MSNILCLCGHKRSTHNYRDKIKQDARESFIKHGNKGYAGHTLEWYMQKADELFDVSQCSAVHCECGEYKQDNLKYLESLI